MVNFSNRDKEIISNVNNFVREKVTALGADGYDFSEPYVREQVIPIGRVMRLTPDGYNGGVGLVPPNYDDYPVEGAIGMRYEGARLHPYLPSGKTGPDSCQTFFVVSAPPASNSIEDIDAVRMKPLINPTFSPRQKNAADPDTWIRGFELALYPAWNNGGTLEADTTNGPISPVADPGASATDDSGAGAGSEGFWYVDYENGIVRFSRPPVNGSDGVMNPNNVFGNINGSYDANGAITMFATFYKYTGEYGVQQDPDFVTVGDGYVSTGSFTGISSNVVQAAVDSLPDEGGTVFIKEGQYDFTTPVEIPVGVHIVGLGGTKIVRPRLEPAFAIMDGYTSISGVEILTRDGTSNGGAIEIRGYTDASYINFITIDNNILHVENDAYGISFAPILCSPQYTGINIRNNMFIHEAANSIAIGETPRGKKASIGYTTIENNYFQLSDQVSHSYAIKIGGSVIDNIFFLFITNNNKFNAEININPSSGFAGGIVISGNDTFGADLNIGNENSTQVFKSTITKNTFANVNIPSMWLTKITNNTITGDATLGTTPFSFSECVVNGNIFEDSTGSITFGDLQDTSVNDNYFKSTLTLIMGSTDNASFSNNTLKNEGVSFGDISNTKMNANQISLNMVAGTIDNGSIISDNAVDGAVVITEVSESTISNNRFGSSFTANQIYLSTIDGNNIGTTFTTTYISASSIHGNSIWGTFLVSGVSSYAVFRSIISNNTVNDLNLSTSSTSTSVMQSEIIGNKIQNDLIIDNTSGSVGYVIDQSIIANNYIYRYCNLGFDVATTETRYILYNSTFSGNYVGNSMTCGDASRAVTKLTYERSVISNNHMEAAGITLYGYARGCEISSNYVATSLTINGDLYAVIISNNYVDDNITIAGDPQFMVASDNCVLLDFVIDGEPYECTMSGNVIHSDLIFGEAVVFTITGNYIGAITTGNDYADQLTITGNITYGIYLGDDNYPDPAGSFMEFTCTANYMAYFYCYVGLDYSVISGNVAGDISFYPSGTLYGAAYSQLTLSSNVAYGEMEFYLYSVSTVDVLSESIISNNQSTYLGLQIGHDNTSGCMLSESVVTGNYFYGIDIQVWNASYTDKAVEYSSINNNFINGDVFIQHRGTTGNTFYDSTFNGNNVISDLGIIALSTSFTSNNIENSMICGNQIIGDVSLTHAGTLNECMKYSSFNENVCNGSVYIGFYTASGHTNGNVLENSNISNNTVAAEFEVAHNGTGATYGRVMYQSLISGNSCQSQMRIGRYVEEDAIKLMYRSGVLNNHAGNTISIGESTKSRTVLSNEDSAVIGNTTAGGLNVRGRSDRCAVCSNRANYLNMGDAWNQSNISSNTFTSGTNTFGSLANSMVSTNTFQGSVTFNGIMSVSNVVGNYFYGIVDCTQDAAASTNFVGNHALGFNWKIDGSPSCHLQDGYISTNANANIHMDTGLRAISNHGDGVYGKTERDGVPFAGVTGYTDTGRSGVFAHGAGGSTGLYAVAESNGYAIEAFSDTGGGVYGYTNGGWPIQGWSGTSALAAVYGYNYGSYPGGEFGSASGAALRLIPDVEPASGGRGDIYVHVKTGRLSTHNNTAFERVVNQAYVVYPAAGADNRTSDGNFANYYTIPSNSLRDGSVIRILAAQKNVGAFSGVINFGIKFNTTLMLNIGGTNAGNNQVIEGHIVIDAISGTQYNIAAVGMGMSDNDFYGGSHSTSGTAFNFSSSYNLYVAVSGGTFDVDLRYFCVDVT